MAVCFAQHITSFVAYSNDYLVVDLSKSMVHDETDMFQASLRFIQSCGEASTPEHTHSIKCAM